MILSAAKMELLSRIFGPPWFMRGMPDEVWVLVRGDGDRFTFVKDCGGPTMAVFGTQKLAEGFRAALGSLEWGIEPLSLDQALGVARELDGVVALALMDNPDRLVYHYVK